MQFPIITLSSPGLVAFHINMWPVRWYGILIALAFLIGFIITEKLIQKNNLSLSYFNELIFLILVFSIVFARLYFVFLSWDYFKDHLNEIPKIWHGGQSIHGVIIGAIFAAFIYSKARKISFYQYMDVIAVVAPLGQAIGRWGNFFNNEAFGQPVTNWLIRLYIPFEYRPQQFLNNDYFHPTFLYESFFDFVLFVFLYKKYPVWKANNGKTFWVYLLSYSIVRFFLEFIRTDSIYFFGGIAYAHVVSVIIIMISAFMLIKK